MAIAWLSYELFEKHFLELKRFWPSGRRPAAAVETAGAREKNGRSNNEARCLTHGSSPLPLRGEG
jgi:hypothetical protein